MYLTCSDVTSWHLVQTLFNDSQRLSHLSQSHQVPIITISVAAHRNIKVNQIVGVVGLSLPQVPLDAGTAEHDARTAEVKRVLGAQNADILSPLGPNPIGK